MEPADQKAAQRQTKCCWKVEISPESDEKMEQI